MIHIEEAIKRGWSPKQLKRKKAGKKVYETGGTMRSLSEFITESVKKVEFNARDYKKFRTDRSDGYMELQPYCEEVYNTYVDEFGDKAPDSPDSKGMRQSPFEKNTNAIIDTSALGMYASKLVRYYVFSRLNGAEPDGAMEEAKDMYNQKMVALGAKSMMI